MTQLCLTTYNFTSFTHTTGTTHFLDYSNIYRITRDQSSGSCIQCLAKITVMVLKSRECLSTLCSTHTVPLYTVQYTHSASLHCAVHTQCLSTLCSTHTVPLYTVQYTHSTSLHCAVHTQCLSTLCSTHTVSLYTVQYTHSASLHCAVHTQCLSTLCSTHTHHGQLRCHNTDYVHINGQDRTITVI